MAGDDSGQVTEWNGSSWLAPVSVDPGRTIYGVSCPSANDNVVTFDGTTLSSPVDALISGPITALVCPAANPCVVAGSFLVATLDGSTWSAPVRLDEEYRHLVGIACVSVTVCTAVDAEGFAYTHSGAW